MINEVRHLFKAGARRFVRSIFNCLPAGVNSFAGRFGYTEIVKRSPRVRFIGRVFETNYIMVARGNHAVELLATARRMDVRDPFYGIRKLGLRDFTMLDIGANVGSYSIGAMGIGAKRVFAVEPGPLFDDLVSNVALNGLEASIVPIHLGLAKEAGAMRWHEDRRNPGNAHLVRSKDDLNLGGLTTDLADNYKVCEVVTLDELAQRLPLPDMDLIKIDVEGMEWEVLSAGLNLVKKNKPIIVAETHRVASDMMRYDCLSPLFNCLYHLGYESWAVRSGSFEKFIYPNFDIDTFFIHRDSLRWSLPG